MEADATPPLQRLDQAVASMLRPHVVLDLLANHGLRDRQKKRRIKIVARFQQYEGANRSSSASSPATRRARSGTSRISGKSLLMLFAARKLRLHPALKNPTVMIVVDRIDLDSQISSTFYAADTPNLVKADSRREPATARAGRAEDHHHHDLQVRRSGRRPQRPQQHHRDGG